MKFAYKLQELRKGCGMSQEEFAELLGVSRQSVSKWESGKGYPEIDKLIFISNYFNTSLDLLLKDTQEPSVPISTKSTRVSKKRKSSVKLTKPQDISMPPKQDTQYLMSDPVPLKKKEGISLKQINVSQNAQIKPVHNQPIYNSNYDSSNKKELHKWLLLLGVFCLATLMITISVSTIYNSNDVYVSTGEDVTAIAMDYVSEYDWQELYKNDMSSSLKEELISDIDSQMQDILIDKDYNVFYSGDDIVQTYVNAKNDMKNSLNCYSLYQKYVSLKDSNNYLEVYSWDYDQWVVINKSMLRKYYSSSGNIPYQVPSMDYNFDDILSNSVDLYLDNNTSPLEQVTRMSNQEVVSISSEIVGICIDALESRKFSLSMEQYIKEFERLKSTFEAVYCNDRGGLVIFVPKSLMLLNLSSAEEQ